MLAINKVFLLQSFFLLDVLHVLIYLQLYKNLNINLIAGRPLVLDFFLEDSELEFQAQLENLEESSAPPQNSELSKIFQDIEKALSTSLVAKVGGIIKFKINGNAGCYYVPFKYFYFIAFYGNSSKV